MDLQGPRPSGGSLTSRQRAMISVQLGHVLGNQGDPAGAENAFQEAIAFDPSFGEAHYFLGRLQGSSLSAEDPVTRRIMEADRALKARELAAAASGYA
ncbi:MAG: hypothetical protein ACRD5L_11780, partial [Bryobacteraceae bacterium]